MVSLENWLHLVPAENTTPQTHPQLGIVRGQNRDKLWPNSIAVLSMPRKPRYTRQTSSCFMHWQRMQGED